MSEPKVIEMFNGVNINRVRAFGEQTAVWGSKQVWQFGDVYGPNEFPIPTPTVTVSEVEDLQLGSSHTIFLKGGKVYAFGTNFHGY